MSATFTIYGRQQMLKAYWRRESGALLNNSVMCLATQVPPSNAALSQVVEPIGSGYARINMPMSTAFWGETGFSEIYNLDAIVFAAPTSTWGLIVGWAIADTLSGQCLAVGGLAEPFATTVGSAPTIEAQGITLGLYD